MPLHDFECSCGNYAIDIYRPVSERASARAPICLECGARMKWAPKVGRMDAYSPMKAFDLDIGEGQIVHVDSLHTLRTIERESERRAANGEGQPIAWRDWSQDQSNRDVNAFGENPQPKLQTRNSRGMPFVTTRGGTPE